jgi:hypothetical protein
MYIPTAPFQLNRFVRIYMGTFIHMLWNEARSWPWHIRMIDFTAIHQNIFVDFLSFFFPFFSESRVNPHLHIPQSFTNNVQTVPRILLVCRTILAKWQTVAVYDFYRWRTAASKGFARKQSGSPQPICSGCRANYDARAAIQVSDSNTAS